MESLRLDKWLWFARFVKSRSLAQALIDEGSVTLNGQPVSKPSTPVKPGDRLTFSLRDRDRTILVRSIAERRGPASVAALLYEETSAAATMTEVTRTDTDNHGRTPTRIN